MVSNSIKINAETPISLFLFFLIVQVINKSIPMKKIHETRLYCMVTSQINAMFVKNNNTSIYVGV